MSFSGQLCRPQRKFNFPQIAANSLNCARHEGTLCAENQSGWGFGSAHFIRTPSSVPTPAPLKPFDKSIPLHSNPAYQHRTPKINGKCCSSLSSSGHFRAHRSVCSWKGSARPYRIYLGHRNTQPNRYPCRYGRYLNFTAEAHELSRVKAAARTS